MKRKINKYSNTKIKFDGYTFSSKKEFNRYCDLTLLEEHGEITELKIKNRIKIIPKTDLFRAVYYEPDFTYYDKYDKFIIEDVKPDFKNDKARKKYHATQAYQMFLLKRKMLYFHTGLQITEV